MTLSLPRTLEFKEIQQNTFALRFIDQTMLPTELRFTETSDWHRVVEAIRALEVRGAPAIGVAGAAAVVLALSDETLSVGMLHERAARIIATRPTAVNLSWGVERIVSMAEILVDRETSLVDIKRALFDEVKRMEMEDEASNRAIGLYGAPLLPDSACVLTYCNAGSLATAYFGTALGVIYTAHDQGRIERVYACETRPVGQGARLTSWELSQAGVPATLICDNMAASLMAAGKVDAVIVGADRITRNGDVANKIGTYSVALAARYHSVPFYVAAPLSTFDRNLVTGNEILIEERDPSEVSTTVPSGVEVYNPAFDVTPASLVTRIITECGVVEPGAISHLF